MIQNDTIDRKLYRSGAFVELEKTRGNSLKEERTGRLYKMRIKSKTSPFQNALETVEALPREDQQALIQLVQRRLIEWRRAEIAYHATTTLEAVRNASASSGSIEELKRDLLSELESSPNLDLGPQSLRITPHPSRILIIGPLSPPEQYPTPLV
jgi:hypothetical protein